MAQTSGEGFNTGKGPGPYGGGRAPAKRRAPTVNDNIRPNSTRPRNTGGGRGGGGRAPRSPVVPYRPPAVGAPSNYGKSSTGQIRPTGSAAAATKPVQKPPAVPDINAYLKADPTYISQQSALNRALVDFNAQQALGKKQYQGQYDLNLADLTKQRTSGFSDLENDYASRGLLQSGVYGKAYSDLENDYKARQTALDTARTNFLANLGTEATGFAGEQREVLERAKQEAAARRLAKYGL